MVYCFILANSLFKMVVSLRLFLGSSDMRLLIFDSFFAVLYIMSFLAYVHILLSLGSWLAISPQICWLLLLRKLIFSATIRVLEMLTHY